MSQEEDAPASEKVYLRVYPRLIDMLTVLRMSPQTAAWSAIPLRLIVGFGFMEHGSAKLARGWESFAQILHTLGVPAPSVLAWATIATELLGGLAVMVGAFIPLVGIPMAAVLL